MGAEMIPATHFRDNGDGTAWCVSHHCEGDHPEGENRLCDLAYKSLDRPCDTCGGWGWVETEVPDGTGDMECPDCDGTGRPTFDIVVDQGLMQELPLRVHVLDVLPIIYPESCRSKAPDKCVEMAPGWDNMLWLSADQEHALPITLPPAAEPGMWAVRLKIHQ